MRKTASSFSPSAKLAPLKSSEPHAGANSALGVGAIPEAPFAEQQAQAFFAHAPTLRQLQILCTLLDDPDALRIALLQNTALHPSFLEHVAEHTDLEQEKAPATVAESLEQLVARTPLPVVQRFLFAHYLTEAGRELEAEDLCLRAIQRGRFLELLAEAYNLDVSPDNAFVAGALSAMPQMTGVRLQEILRILQTPQEVKDLLQSQSAPSAERDLLALAQYIEAGDWNASEDVLAACSIPGEHAATLYGKAAIWTWMLLG